MKDDSPIFSLVMGTLGRTDEIQLFIKSLLKQVDAPSWELIIVDQNNDDRVEKILQSFSSILSADNQLRLIKIKKRGLSIARNIGLNTARGQIIAFPDDDCIYGPHVLKFISEQLFSDPGLDGITLFDVKSYAALEDHRNVSAVFQLNDYNVFQRAISYTIFLRKPSSNYRFDERFGVGATYGATEETDYLFRMIGEGAVIKQMGGPVVFHPDKALDFSNVERAFSYNVGVGAFFTKHFSLQRPYFILFFLISWCKLLVRLLQKSIFFLSIDRRWYFSIARGRLVGMWRFLRENRNSHPGPK